MIETTIIVAVSPKGFTTAKIIAGEIGGKIINYKQLQPGELNNWRNIIFVGAMGICVRAIAPLVRDKHSDPAVVCVDSAGKFVIPVLSGHVGGANDLALAIAGALGATPVVTTQSDGEGLIPLDTVGAKYGWQEETVNCSMNEAIFKFVGHRPTAFIFDVRDRGVDELRKALPEHARAVKSVDEAQGCELIVAVTPRIYPSEIPTLYYRPKVLTLGVGCRKGCNPEGISAHISKMLKENGLSFLSLKTLATIQLKENEPMLKTLAQELNIPQTDIFTSEELAPIEVPNPSDKVRDVTGVWGVAESSAIAAANGGSMLIEKQKGCVVPGNEFTFAVAFDADFALSGHIEIVGAGPGDPELVSVRGRRFLENADLILYAGSLVPRELTDCHKPGCIVRSSAPLNLEEQFALMKSFYDEGKLVVRLHTGDPCIYGAIQEQMALFDEAGMSYHITPGISSFQAAAAELRSQFTIPEKVQTIILTRGEGRTPMPEREQLHKLAQSQSTMCIFLSAGIAEEVERELLQAYPPTTPVAACYKLTWKEQRIYRGELKDLAKIVKDNNLTLTTLLVVGDAIDNRHGLSKLYNDSFKHIFRK